MNTENLDIKKILQDSYRPTSLARQQLVDRGYKFDDKLSNINSKVFTDEKGNPHITFRGSVNATDFLRDDTLLTLGLGRFSPRLQQAKALVKKVEAKYNKPADVYGSSLGGFLAENSGAGGKIVTHNKAVPVTDMFKVIPKNQIDIRSENDLVSAIGGYTQTHKGKFITTPGKKSFYETHLPEALPDDKEGNFQLKGETYTAGMGNVLKAKQY